MLVVRREAAPQDGAGAAPVRIRGHVALAVAATSLLSVLVAWGALIGPEQVFTGPGPTPSTQTTTPPPTPLDELAPAPPGEVAPPGARSSRWVSILLSVLAGGILLWLLLVTGFLLRKAWQVWQDRRRDARLPPGGVFEALTPGDRVVAAVRADVEAQDAALQEGTPRNAIVAAWHRFELQGERAGLARTPSETSSEFTRRVLDLLDTDAAAVTRLGELYREARFSRHELGEQHRAAAVEALAAIRASTGGGR